jgi:NADH-quinone oxidoreductase subunit E
MFTLETVNCLGACALAPILVVDGNYHGQTTVQKVDSILDKYQKETASEEIIE